MRPSPYKYAPRAAGNMVQFRVSQDYKQCHIHTCSLPTSAQLWDQSLESAESPEVAEGGEAMEGETTWHVAFALYHKRIENGSESQTRHDWQRRPGVTSATTDLEMVDLSRTMSAPSAHWTRTSGPPAQQLRNLAFVTFGGSSAGPLLHTCYFFLQRQPSAVR